ncbi:hypothetical protein ACOYR1_11235 [Thalassotalea piscium]
MKKWYFSNNGEISGPMNLASARKVVENSSGLYGWHPSFTTWKPVSVIGEFADIAKESKVASQVPQEIINEFNNKRTALIEKLKLVNENIKETEIIKAKLKKKISLYRHLTEDLNEEVQSAIVSVEQQYTTFGKQLIQLEEAAKISNNEIEEITAKFQQQISNKNEQDGEPSAQVSKISTSTTADKASVTADEAETVIDIDEDFELIDETVNLVDEDASAETTVKETKEDVKQEPVTKIKKISTETTPATRLVIDTKTTDGARQPKKISTQEHLDPRIKPAVRVIDTSEKSNQTATETANQTTVSKITAVEAEDDKKGLAGVKGMFKSVFKGSEPEPKLSAQLKMSEAIKDSNATNVQASANDEASEVIELKKVVNESETISTMTDEESEKDKKARRRRRRR